MEGGVETLGVAGREGVEGKTFDVEGRERGVAGKDVNVGCSEGPGPCEPS